MRNKLLKNISIVVMLFTMFTAGSLNSNEIQADAAQTKVSASFNFKKEAKKLRGSNKQLKKDIKALEDKIAKKEQQITDHKSKKDGSTNSSSKSELAKLNYSGKQEVIVDNNKPGFSDSDMSTANGPWQKYGDLDSMNRVTGANAMLNQSLMPTAKRERLFVNPTGWHNKKVKGGWLYNRSHLIGYQFTGQNNNPKNLMTGTASLNSPEMLHHEMDVAYYLKGNRNRYVRYRVTPIFRGNELLARGVQMEAQSVGNDAIHFNVYIFNVQSGVTLNYNDGTSQVYNQ
nr:DNA/RNA non-specific endonuclease [Companilactobacillus mishanensis]